MGEVLTDSDLQPSVAVEQNGSADGPLTYRERLRQGTDRVTEGAMSMTNLAAGIVLARDDLRLTRRAMDTLDEAQDGLLGRQAADPASMELRDDVFLDFRRDAQRAGFTDTNAMPGEIRAQTAQGATARYADQIRQELQAAHPEWDSVDLEAAASQRAADFAALLGMNTEEYSAFAHAQVEYHDLISANGEIQASLSEMRAERNERLSRMGHTALRGVVSFVDRVRSLPNALSARAVVAGMGMSDRIHSMSAEKKRKTLWGTAAGVAIAGIASYAAFRAGHAPGGGNNYALASADSPLLPTGVGSNLPSRVGDIQLPSGVGAGSEFIIPTSVGDTVLPSQVGGTELPSSVGADVLPSQVGVDSQPLPSGVGTSSPNLPTSVGGQDSLPSSVGVDPSLPGTVGSAGESLVDAQSSSELFGGKGTVELWPDKIRVSAWNSTTLDGSLSGISRQMLVRSGISSPTGSQIDTLVDVLRPQAQPNGWLQKGQELDLRPATSALKGILQK